MFQPGNLPLAANVTWVMSMNADPKPGRWILPLVILGMIAFTYYFVRELPEAAPNTTISAGATSTTAADSTTTTEVSPTDPIVQAYLDAVDAINADLQLARTELVAANAGFDANPREVEYPVAVTRFEAVVAETNELVGRFNELTPPEGLDSNHTLLGAELTTTANAANDALGGLRSPDPGAIRRANVQAYVTAAEEFDAQVTALKTAAGAT